MKNIFYALLSLIALVNIPLCADPEAADTQYFLTDKEETLRAEKRLQNPKNKTPVTDAKTIVSYLKKTGWTNQKIAHQFDSIENYVENFMLTNGSLGLARKISRYYVKGGQSLVENSRSPQEVVLGLFSSCITCFGFASTDKGVKAH